MFVAITFGSSMIKVENPDAMRAFLDPTLGHFVQVLVTACRRAPFGLLATATVVVLLNGIDGACELMVWLALSRSRAK